MSGFAISSGPKPHQPPPSPHHSLGCRCAECLAKLPTQIARQSKPRITLIGQRTWLCMSDTSPGGFGMSPAAAYYDWMRRVR